MVTGKGGIGKTVIATALAHCAAYRGRRSLVVESGAVDQIAPLFGQPPIGHQTTLVAPGLKCINIQPVHNFREYVTKYLGQKMLYEAVFENRVVQSFIRTIPGLSDLMVLGRLFYEAELKHGDHPNFIAFDGYASGHFLSLMTTPDAVLAAGFGGPLKTETERTKAFLQQPDCVSVYVATPESLVISESLEFIPQLVAKSPSRLAMIILNRVPLELFHPEVQAAEDPGVEAFLAGKRTRALRAMRLLQEGLNQWSGKGEPPKIIALPELGCLYEPWDRSFGQSFLSAAVEGLDFARAAMERLPPLEGAG